VKRVRIAAVALVLISLVAGLYGALHDQLSFTISPEYFTLFKYKQFRFTPEQFGGHRATVAVIGFLATWWVGAIAALFIMPLGFLFKDPSGMRKEMARATIVMLMVAMASGLIGLGFGWLDPEGRSLLLPGWMHAFSAVGRMHNFSYAGGAIGLCAAVTVMVWRSQRNSGSTRMIRFGRSG
jgi:hypothetical protein